MFQRKSVSLLFCHTTCSAVFCDVTEILELQLVPSLEMKYLIISLHYPVFHLKGMTIQKTIRPNGFVTVVNEYRPNYWQRLRIYLESTSPLFDVYNGPFLRE